MHKLVAAVQQREPEANVLVVDWLNFAHQLYPDAVNHTRRVGLSIADLLNWLQVCMRLCVCACASVCVNVCKDGPMWFGFGCLHVSFIALFD